MNENKIAFIICSNDEVCVNECMRYINRLNVPDGIETDVIVVQGAKSMCEGYNAAMNDSDAKYKVYMHQDVFILNVNFIADIIKIFRGNPQYGMLGVCGSDHVVPSANYWAEWNVGAVRWGSNYEEVAQYSFGRNEPRIMTAFALDGMFMVTQYDVMWREDLFDAFDFYDISQSFEFIKAGYLVGVVPQAFLWCHHDCGWSNMSRYDRYRKIFCEEYAGYGFKYEEIEVNTNQRDGMGYLDKRGAELAEILERGRDGDESALDKMCEMIDVYHMMNRTIAIYLVILQVIITERRNGSHEFSGGGRFHTADEMTSRFISLKYFLRRVELGFPLEDDEIYKEISAREDKRLVDLRAIAQHVTLEPEATIKRLEKELGV